MSALRLVGELWTGIQSLADATGHPCKAQILVVKCFCYAHGHRVQKNSRSLCRDTRFSGPAAHYFRDLSFQRVEYLVTPV